MSQYLEQLKQHHHDLDVMIQELHARHYPDEYIKPYKVRKLSLKEEIAREESKEH